MRLSRLVAGAAGLGFVHVLVSVSGGPLVSPLHPLIYAYVALLAAVYETREALVVALLAALIEVGLSAFDQGPGLVVSLVRAGMVLGFGALFAAVLRGEILRLKLAHRRALDHALGAVEQDARDFRLTEPSDAFDEVGVPGGVSVDSTQRRWVGSVKAIREALDDLLELGRTMLDADTAMFLSADESGQMLTLKAVATRGQVPSSIERPVPATEGAVGAVVRGRQAVRMQTRDAGYRLGHPAQKEARAFVGVPVLDGDRLVGVLTATRAQARPFDDGDEGRLVAFGREVLRAVESERIFVTMDRARLEQERFFDAFALLNEALTVEVVAERLLDAVHRVKPIGFGAVTTYDPSTDRHTVLHARGAGSGALAGKSFAGKGGGLVAMAIKNGHSLPYVPLSEQPDRVGHQVFGPDVDVDLRSVKVFPLQDREGPLGSLVVGSEERGQELSREEERMVSTIAAHGAVTLTNARMYRAMETMATTDPLTGTSNRRRFSELLEEAIARAERFDRKVTVLMIDADHFKAVNDTYGHAIGDEVLVRISKVLLEEARRTDVVARLGGEEFVLMLDETSIPGALQVAERVRERVAAEVVQAEFGGVSVTVSLGLATLPEHASAAEDLLDKADKALYDAKSSGRNCVKVFGRVRCKSPEESVIGGEEGRLQT